MDFVEGYLEYLHEDRGPSFPIERDDYRPNYIRACMVQEDDRVKIRCLRKLKELTAMNPFYQYRIDRFVDAITNTYERTEEPGFHEYKLEESIQNRLSNFFKKSNKTKIKLDGKKISVGAGMSGPSPKDIKYIISNYLKWKKQAENILYKRNKKRIKLIPLAADFGPTYLYFYFKFEPSIDEWTAGEVLIDHKSEKVIEVDYIDIKDLRL